MTKAFGHGQRVTLAAMAIVILAALNVQPLRASTVSVGTCVTGGAHYTTIQAAVTAVTAGSTIEVCPGNYPEQVVIAKNLTLKGVTSGSAQNPTLVVPGAGFAANATTLSGGSLATQIEVESPATAVTISYLAVDGTGNNLNSGCNAARLVGIFFKSASGTLNYVVARNQAQNTANFSCGDSAGLGIFVESAGTAKPATVTIKNSTVYGFQKNGITANETGTTVTLNNNSVIGAGPVDIAQNSIQIGYGATGTVENNTVGDDVFNGDPSAGTGSGILVYDSGNLSITGNSVAFTQGGIVIATDGNQTDNDNTLTNNQVVNTQVGDGIDLCSNGNTVTSNTVFSASQSGIHLDSSCVAASIGSNNTVSKNVVNDACAGILLGSGTGNTFPTANTYANVANTTLAGDTCTPVIVPEALVKNTVSSAGHNSAPARP